jgi:hypothetical protein
LAIPLLGELERLINERGSAAIMKERLSLANDQYIALERKLADAIATEAESQALAQSAELRANSVEAEKLKLELEVQRLSAELDKLKNAEPLKLRYGIYWSADGTPHCNKCKAPITNFGWATYFGSQVKAMYCNCSKTPLILHEYGEPVHAPDAMRAMAPRAA